jgi:tetratricopeptide (TPR) repeat protein
MPVPAPVPVPVPPVVPTPPAPSVVAKVVRVRAGALHVDASEHVQVATSDATVDGAADYDVVVAGDQLRSVAVKSGNVAVRVRGQQAVFLAAGDDWKPKTAKVVVATEVQDVPSPGPSPSADNDAQHVTESHFAAGWQLLKSERYEEAAHELAVAADAGGALAGDARYFQAEALTKAGHAPEAEHALVAFLDASPHSLRRGRASVMLARLIAARGDAKSARAWFESALHDADPDVAAAASAGLAALH